MNTLVSAVVAAATAPSPDAPMKSDLPGFNVLLMGPSGTGKTHACGTLVDAAPQSTVFYLGLEAGLESLLGHWADRKLPIPANLHWHQLEAKTADFSTMLADATKINTQSLEGLAKMIDPNRSKHNTFLTLLGQLNNFKCDRTGETFGAVNNWGPDRILIIDGMTGLAEAAMSLVVGGKPVRSQSDWGIAQDQVAKLLRMLCDGCRCHFILLAHVERETDQVMGGVKIMVSTLGKALAPKIPAMFSDVIMTVRQGTTWTWDTASGLADVKTRNLPIKADNPPTFAPIVAKWLARGGKFTA